MSESLAEAKLITCILSKGKAYPLQQALIEEKNIHSVNFHLARGVGRFSPLTSRGIGEQQIKEILEATVPAEIADEIFEYIFYKGEMDQAHGGIVYMTSLPKATEMHMTDLTAEKERRSALLENDVE